MRYHQLLLIGFMTIELSASTLIPPALAEEIVTERELKAILSIMKSRKLRSDRDELMILAQEKISIKRFKEILSQMTMVMPYVNAERSYKNLDEKRLSQKQLELVNLSRLAVKDQALRYFEKQPGQNDLDQIMALFEQYADQINADMPHQFHVKPKSHEGTR